MPQIRMKAEQRRSQILSVASELFAERSFHGLTTKDLARRLEITEPVLYQHFSSKDELWMEVKKLHRFPFHDWEKMIKSTAPSTSHFLFITGMLVWGITLGRSPGSMEPVARHPQILRLLGHGLFETGGPLRLHQEHFAHTILPWWMMSFQAASVNDDLHLKEVSDEILWLAFGQMLSLALTEASRPHLLASWDTEKERLTHLTRFLLRGLGVKENVIQREFSFARLYQGFTRLSDPQNPTT